MVILLTFEGWRGALSSKSEFLFLKFVFIFGESTFGIGESSLYFFWLLDIGNLVVGFWVFAWEGI